MPDLREPRLAMGATEHQEQAALVLRVKAQIRDMYDRMTAVPHGGYRSKKTAKILKAEGVRAGYPDLLVDLPRGPFHGFRCEMKRPDKSKSRVSDEQAYWIRRLQADGYFAVVAWGQDQAIALFRQYYALGDFTCPAGTQLTNSRREIWACIPRENRDV